MRRQRASALAMSVGLLALTACAAEDPSPKHELVRYEDGSGVLTINGREVEVYPEDTFVWHCESMGNHVCGDVDDADLQP